MVTFEICSVVVTCMYVFYIIINVLYMEYTIKRDGIRKDIEVARNEIEIARVETEQEVMDLHNQFYRSFLDKKEQK